MLITMNVDQLLNGKGNLMDTYVSCLGEHKVIIDSQQFYLIKTFYGTNSRVDFLNTFSNQLDNSLLEKANIIPNEIAYNEYAVIYDMSLKVVAVFNMNFASYDFKKRKIIFKDPEDILLSYYKKNIIPNNKSVEEQINEKFDVCLEKVNMKISSIKEQKALPPNEPNQTGQSRSINTLNQKKSTVKPPRSSRKGKKKKKRKEDYMRHAIMYAAAPPVKE